MDEDIAAGPGTTSGRDRDGTRFSLPPVRPVRQIAIIGDSIGARTLAILLDRGGRDALLIRTTDRSHRFPERILPPAGRNVLESMGVGDRITDGSVSIESYRRLRVADGAIAATRYAADEGARVPWIVSERALLDRLEYELDPAMTVTKQVEDVRHRDDLPVVEFSGDVAEQFDLVVDARGRTSAAADGRKPEAEDQSPIWEGAAAVEVGDVPDGMTDVTAARTNVQIGPSAEHADRAIVRFQSETESPDHRTVRNALADLEGIEAVHREAVGTALRRGDPWETTQATAVAPRWRRESIAFVGGRTFPSADGAAVGPTLALEDAWVLADELLHGPSTIHRALEYYQRRRRARVRAVIRRVRASREGGAGGVAESAPLAVVDRLRSFAFGPLLSDGLARLHDAVPLRR